MRESGLLKKWTAEWTPSNLQCKGLGPVTTAKEATLDDFQGAFYLLIIGILLACILLVVELAYSYRTSYVTEEDECSILEADVRLGHYNHGTNKKRPLYSNTNNYNVKLRLKN